MIWNQVIYEVLTETQSIRTAMCTWNGIFNFLLLRELWTYWISSTLTTSCRSFYYQLPISSTSVHNDFSGYLFPCRRDCICKQEWEFSNITCRHGYCSCSRNSWRRKTTQYRGYWWAPSPFPACLLWVFSNSYQPTTALKWKKKEGKGHNPLVRLSMPGYPCVVANFRSPRSHLDKLCSRDIYPSIFFLSNSYASKDPCLSL